MKIGALLVMVILCGLAFAACNDTPFPATCSDIPAGGCPEDNGAEVCSDCTCRSVYACDNGKWVFAMDCPANPCPEAGSGDASPMDATVVDVSYDAPPGAYGGDCVDLELPDCQWGTAEACAAMPGCCGCIDVWVCQNGGWMSWGTCGNGGLVPNK
jgi:hypothetical protein